jgi:hypothetical protein
VPTATTVGYVPAPSEREKNRAIPGRKKNRALPGREKNTATPGTRETHGDSRNARKTQRHSGREKTQH